MTIIGGLFERTNNDWLAVNYCICRFFQIKLNSPFFNEEIIHLSVIRIDNIDKKIKVSTHSFLRKTSPFIRFEV